MPRSETKTDKLLKLFDADVKGRGVAISTIEREINPNRDRIYGLIHNVRDYVAGRKQTIVLKGGRYFLIPLKGSKKFEPVGIYERASLGTMPSASTFADLKLTEKKRAVLDHLVAHNDTGSAVDDLVKASGATKLSIYALIKEIKLLLPQGVRIKSIHARYFLKGKALPSTNALTAITQRPIQVNSVNVITDALTTPVPQQTLTIEEIAALPSASERSDAIEYLRQSVFYSMIARDVISARKVTNHLRLQVERLVPVH